MSPVWFVDSSNVIGSRPDGWWHDRPQALSRLVDEVVRWHDVEGDAVVLIADGHPSARVPEGVLYGVEVHYARSTERDAADDEIVRYVGAHLMPDTLVVVTSDRRLRERVVQLGAQVEGAKRFLARVAAIEPRRLDRAVLAHFGIDESALLGRGGEARVFALDEDRVVRLPHPGVQAATLEDRRKLLDAIGSSGAPVALPEVIEHVEVEARTVVIERRLPGRNAMEVLAERTTDRGTLIRDHLDVARMIHNLRCPTDCFGEIWGDGAITASSFGEWAVARLEASLSVAGEEFIHVDPTRLTDDLVNALDNPEPVRPALVHLDVFLGNMLAANDHITALLDFGPMTVGGPPDLDALAAIAYLAPEITPDATAQDEATARAWAGEADLTDAVEPANRWIAAYWTGATEDQRLRHWCRRILLE